MKGATTLRSPLLTALVVVLFAGCAALAPREVPDDREVAWEALRAELEALSAWHARGRLSVQMGDDGGSAGFDWREHPGGDYALRLSGPWGQGVARIEGGDGYVRLDEGDGQVLEGASARLLLWQRFGWDVPVDGLRRWLMGLPTGDAAPDAYTLDDFGRLEHLRWEEWEIAYRRYTQVDGLDLPADLTIRHVAEGTRIRVAVDNWQPAAPGEGESSGIPLIGE